MLILLAKTVALINKRFYLLLCVSSPFGLLSRNTHAPARFIIIPMYIFYIDESGKASDPYLSHIIYSGFAIHDTSYGYIVNSLDKLVRQHFDCELKNIPEIHARQRPQCLTF